MKISKRQVIATTLFVLWLLSVFYAVFIYQVEDASYTPPIEIKDLNSTNPDIPPIHLEAVYKFVTKGSFSAENPITISVKVINCNVTNLLDYYGCVGFWGSVFATNQPQYTPQGVEVGGYVPLTKGDEGTYVGTATLKWNVESDAYTFLVPQPNYNFTFKVGPSSGELPLMHISPSSETTTWRFNEITTRFTIILVGFSFLMLQPIFEVIFRTKEH